MEKQPKSMYRVRLSDCDIFGHLNNARYIDYFLNAREDHLRDHYGMDLKEFYSKGIMWVVGSHEILYRRPAMYNELVTVSSSLIQVQADSLLVELHMMDEQEKHIKSICWTSFIPVNTKTGKKENHAEEFYQFAESIRNPGVETSAGLRARELSLRTVNQL